MTSATEAPPSTPASRPPSAARVEARQKAHWDHVLARRQALRETLGALFEQDLTRFKAVDLEIGCGHGHFLDAYAAANADVACVGVDYCNERVQRAVRKQTRAGRANLRFLKAEASEFLEFLPEHVHFRRVFLLFPDPWPKKRHAKYRLMAPAFLARLATRVRAGGTLLFRTDSATYFEEARAVVSACTEWNLAEAAPWPFEHATVFQTKCHRHHSLVAIRTPRAR